ncbi:MAG: LysM peptidoglycan-binding domain-containing protein, partial [Proteobacteria bacterium]|nr:LysM peptidoglycan-binding domain-containing protein [Pseudomonadota bacterium]
MPKMMPGMMPGMMPRMEPMPYAPNDMHCPMGTRPHVVRTGDTLYSLAMSYETTIDEILSYNPQITDPSRIYMGQVICMPYKQECDGERYTVMPGDTLYGIAMQHNISIEEIMAANPQINNPNL